MNAGRMIQGVVAVVWSVLTYHLCHKRTSDDHLCYNLGEEKYGQGPEKHLVAVVHRVYSQDENDCISFGEVLPFESTTQIMTYFRS